MLDQSPLGHKPTDGPPMPMADQGGPAFPTETADGWAHGMSLRDYFAATLVAAFFAGPYARDESSNFCKSAYELADLMLEYRKRTPAQES